ncbi:1181_t:CDS:2, partial [Cetraspora pellucida]
NGEVYVKLIRRHTFRAVRRLVPNSQGIFQQDNATLHKYWKVKAAFSRAKVERRLQNSPDKPTSIDDLEKKVIAA